MYIWLLIAGLVCFGIAIILLENKLHKLTNRFDALVEKHNAFVDCVRDDLDNVYTEANERIDEINEEFMNVHKVLTASKEFADDVTDTMELMCDTDEIIIDRLSELEDDVDMMWEAVEEHDEILYSFFEDEPEQVETKKETKEKKTKKK